MQNLMHSYWEIYFYVNLTQTGIYREEGDPIEKILP